MALQAAAWLCRISDANCSSDKEVSGLILSQTKSNIKFQSRRPTVVYLMVLCIALSALLLLPRQCLKCELATCHAKKNIHMIIHVTSN